MAETASRKTLVWIIGGVGAALIAAMLIVKIWFASTVFFPSDEVVSSEPATQVLAQDAPLDPDERIARDMVTPVTPGTPVMPDPDVQLNPSDYSTDLSSVIPIKLGMSRYAAVDELLLYYNNDPASGAKVSSNERMIDGATLYVIRRSGMADDSVSSEETFALFDNDVLGAFGTRIQCQRGPSVNQWTTEPCP